MAARSSKNNRTSPQPVAVNDVRALRTPLLRWYRKHRRDLPWRAPKSHGREAAGVRWPTPYAVMVSEAMLQQTQVATVIPYFHRFTAAFPTLADLADADEQAVLRQWQGLGYYRRARNLHAAAKACVERFAGQVPDTVDDLLSLPGVGRYTAGAIASIAYGRPAPILDGNVARVLARTMAIRQPIDQTATRNQLWALAETLVHGDSPGDLNQALMELGALVCTPRNPGCLMCPVRDRCGALQAGLVEQLPAASPRRAPQTVTHTILAVCRGGRYLFEQRPSTGLWSNMWQLPTHESSNGPLAESAAWIADRFGLDIASPTEAASFQHQTTHRTIRFVLLRADAPAGRLKPGRGVWRKLDALDDLPLSNPQRKAVKLLCNTNSSSV